MQTTATKQNSKAIDLSSERWAFQEGDRERQAMSTIFKADDKDFLIGYAICESRNDLARAEDLARTRLMAAAPRLLAMLLELKALVHSEQPHLLNNDDGEPDELCLRIEAAIADARGPQS